MAPNPNRRAALAWRLLLLALLLFVIPAQAHGDAPALPQPSASPPLVETPVDAFGPAMQLDSLDALRGGDVRIQTVTDLDGDVVDNTASNVTTGSNAIGGDAFAGSAGITTVIQNSGANVLIQSGTAVNVQFTDPTP